MHFIAVLIRAQGSGLERMLGLLRRRAATLATMQISFSRDQNLATVSLTVQGNLAVAQALAEHLRKLTDVIQATVIEAEIGA